MSKKDEWTIRCSGHNYITLEWNEKFVFCLDNDMMYAEEMIYKIEKRTGVDFRNIKIKGQKEAADEEPEYDEHIWLSIRNAEIMVKNIEKAIEQLDSDNAKVYQTNAENYIKKLNTLDKQYANTIQNAKYKAILFGDRFPFRYMADDYDLKYYAAFAGCSAETMAGFETVTFLAKKADELRLPVILTIENSDGRIAEAVKSNTTKKNQKILAMNSLQSVTKEQIADGITYLQVMQENLSVLSEALN